MAGHSRCRRITLPDTNSVHSGPRTPVDISQASSSPLTPSLSGRGTVMWEGAAGDTEGGVLSPSDNVQRAGFTLEPPDTRMRIIVSKLVRAQLRETQSAAILVLESTVLWGSFASYLGHITWILNAIILLEGYFELNGWVDEFAGVKCCNVASEVHVFSGLKKSFRLRIGVVTIRSLLCGVLWKMVGDASARDRAHWLHTPDTRWYPTMYLFLVAVCVLQTVHSLLGWWALVCGLRFWVASKIPLLLLLPFSSQEDLDKSSDSTLALTALTSYIHHKRHLGWRAFKEGAKESNCNLEAWYETLTEKVHLLVSIRRGSDIVSEAGCERIIQKILHIVEKQPAELGVDGLYLLEVMLQEVCPEAQEELRRPAMTTVMVLLEHPLWLLDSVRKVKCRSTCSPGSHKKKMDRLKERLGRAAAGLDRLWENQVKNGEPSQALLFAKSTAAVLREAGNMDVWMAKFLHRQAESMRQQGDIMGALSLLRECLEIVKREDRKNVGEADDAYDIDFHNAVLSSWATAAGISDSMRVQFMKQQFKAHPGAAVTEQPEPQQQTEQQTPHSHTVHVYGHNTIAVTAEHAEPLTPDPIRERGRRLQEQSARVSETWNASASAGAEGPNLDDRIPTLWWPGTVAAAAEREGQTKQTAELTGIQCGMVRTRIAEIEVRSSAEGSGASGTHQL